MNNERNKKSYVKPELSCLGSVEEITLQFGFGGTIIPATDNDDMS